MVTMLEPVTNGAKETIELQVPYLATVSVMGVAPYLYHAWNVEAVEAKGKAAKGSKAKKTDDVENYVYRLEDGGLGIPGEQLRMSVVTAAKFRQDPRSPRKSAMDLYKAGVVSLTELAPLGKKEWDYLDQRRAVIQRSGITRTRPALRAGWLVTFELQILLPEYISPTDLNDVVAQAGRLCGLGDFRPTYGRFQVTRFDVAALI